MDERKLKIAFFEVEPWEKDYLKKRLPQQQLYFFADILKIGDLTKIKDCRVLSPFIYSKINAAVIKKLPDLKFVATRSTGFDHIDIRAARAAQVLVANVPTYGENTVAEHTFALILSLSRKIHQSYERTARGNFSLEGLRGFDLKSRTIGIIGCGHIGQHVVRMAHGFGMKVLVYDVKENRKLARQLGFQYVSLNDLLKKSDIVSLHAPYNKATHHIINRKNIKIIKKGAMLINTARGGLVDTTALVDGLRSGRLSGIGLDVLEEEKYILKEEAQLLSPHFGVKGKESVAEYLRTIVEGHMLLISDKVIVTPHNAFNSQEALERILDTTIENIKDFSARKKLKNLIR